MTTKMIRVHPDVKEKLDGLGLKTQSYNDIIKSLIETIKKEEKIQIKKTKDFYSWASRYKFLTRFYIYCERCHLYRAEEMHHIDKDRSNNSKDNIELLCKQCHIDRHYKFNKKKMRYSKKIRNNRFEFNKNG